MFSDTLQAPTQAELDTLYSQLKLLDPAKEGITANLLRPFYPRASWTEIFQKLHGLVDAGKASKAARSNGGSVQFEYFTWA